MSFAAEEIGQAVGVTPAASGTIAAVLSPGSAVYRDEVVSTGPSGVLELRFADSSHLALGSSSQVKLDDFVYSGSKGTAVDLGRGAFRFVSGSAPKRSYRIRTPQATIGLRGTDFTARITDSYEQITIWEGAIRVCLRAVPTRCADLSRSGDTVTIANGGISRRGDDPVHVKLICRRTMGEATLCTSANSPVYRPERDGSPDRPGGRSLGRSPRGGRGTTTPGGP